MIEINLTPEAFNKYFPASSSLKKLFPFQKIKGKLIINEAYVRPDPLQDTEVNTHNIYYKELPLNRYKNSLTGDIIEPTRFTVYIHPTKLMEMEECSSEIYKDREMLAFISNDLVRCCENPENQPLLTKFIQRQFIPAFHISERLIEFAGRNNLIPELKDLTLRHLKNKCLESYRFDLKDISFQNFIYSHDDLIPDFEKCIRQWYLKISDYRGCQLGAGGGTTDTHIACSAAVSDGESAVLVETKAEVPLVGETDTHP